MQVVFKKVVHSDRYGCSSADRVLHRIVEMPFVPPVGMEVIDGDWTTDVASLCFADGVLYAFTEDDRPGRARSTEELERSVEEWKENGWSVSDGLLSHKHKQ